MIPCTRGTAPHYPVVCATLSCSVCHTIHTKPKPHQIETAPPTPALCTHSFPAAAVPCTCHIHAVYMPAVPYTCRIHTIFVPLENCWTCTGLAVQAHYSPSTSPPQIISEVADYLGSTRSPPSPPAGHLRGGGPSWLPAACGADSEPGAGGGYGTAGA